MHVYIYYLNEHIITFQVGGAGGCMSQWNYATTDPLDYLMLIHLNRQRNTDKCSAVLHSPQEYE